MRKTEQYGLNQWDLTDPIRMEDFNADNARLEAALAALAAGGGGLEILRTDLNRNSSSVGIPPTDSSYKPVNLSDYNIFLVIGNAVPNSSVSAKTQVRIAIEETPDYNYIYEDAATFTIPTGGYIYVLFPCKNKDLAINGYLLAGDGIHEFIGTAAFDEIKYFMIRVTNASTGADVPSRIGYNRMIGIR